MGASSPSATTPRSARAHHGERRPQLHLRRGRGQGAGRRAGLACRLRSWAGTGAPLRGRLLRRGDLHLPPAVRRRSRGDAGRAGSRAPARWHARQPGVPRPDERAVAGPVVAVHAPWAAGRRAGRVAALVRGGEVPRAEYLGLLPAPSVGRPASHVAGGWHLERPGPSDEPGWGARRLGDQAGARAWWVTSGRPSTRSAPARGVTT